MGICDRLNIRDYTILSEGFASSTLIARLPQKCKAGL